MKGVSPIISTVLMIAIAIAAAVVVYYVTMEIVSSQSSQVEQQATAGQEVIQIESIAASTSEVNAYVRNLGKREVNVTDAYILKEDGSTQCKGTITSTTINPGEVKEISVSGCTLSAGNYQLKVVTKNGAMAVKAFTVSS